MSQIGPSIMGSFLQTAANQTTAAQTKDKERLEKDRVRRFRDQVELRVEGTESTEAVRRLPQNDSEQAEDEHRRHAAERQPGKDERPRIDLQA